jgi:hypothetical protein
MRKDEKAVFLLHAMTQSLMHRLVILPWLLSVVRPIIASHDLCEKRDGDCPHCPGIWSHHNPTAKVLLSSEPSLVASVKAADNTIRNGSTAAGADIIRFDDPEAGLHTSLFYFCCHSSAEVRRMKAALQAMNWTSFIINYDNFGCNLDHDGTTVYLHALPQNQTELFAWAALVEATLAAADIPVNHPRASLFHMTLARVTPTYPTDSIVQRLNHTHFGSHRLCSFLFDDLVIKAHDCTQS